MASGGADKVVCVWDASSGVQQSAVRARPHAGGQGVRQACSRAAPCRRTASGPAERCVGTVIGADCGVWRAAQLHGMPEMVTGLAFTCDARALVAAGSDAALRMWDLTSGRVRHTLTGHVAKVHHVVHSGTLCVP